MEEKTTTVAVDTKAAQSMLREAFNKITRPPVDAPREDSGEEDSNLKTWNVTDQDGRAFDVALDDDGVLDVGVAPLRQPYIDGAYVVVVKDAVTDEERIVGVYFDDEDAEQAANEIERFGVSRNDRSISALEFLRNGGESIDPKTARELQGVTALEYLNDEY